MTELMPIGVFARATRLSVRALRNYDGLGQALAPGFAGLYAGLAAQGLAPTGPGGTRYLSDDLDAAELEVELFVPVARPPRPTATIAAGELPGCLLAATVHEGGYDDVGTAYRSLGRWIAEPPGPRLDNPRRTRRQRTPRHADPGRCPHRIADQDCVPTPRLRVRTPSGPRRAATLRGSCPEHLW
ncbi:hypothetical protein GCM10010399_33290 [Dactylosporangium fulvum]|uniref:Uncharacterized protein n=1 Tax=Dactylosporangium fulvum TaxID=53359 RepID=A0ABY5VZD5_9ACTN|nr:hypothetical protein [Dactylosporangium fulvum]UWP82524.1 hypothetical protein Dfulv_47065 [Dactylosporangium fulvum]